MYTHSLRNTLIAVAVAAALGVSAGAVAQTPESVRLEAHSDGMVAAISDTLITSNVKSRLAGDSRLKNSEIDVTTTDGAVTLTGYATDPDAKSAAAAVARSVEGVKTVRDDLKTPSAAASLSSDAQHAARTVERVASDSWITTKVKAGIAADSLSKGFDVGVTTKHGAVVLDGTLSSADAIEHVKEIAEKVKDVKSVDTSALRTSST
jgi:hyperosmotically inducible protein